MKRNAHIANCIGVLGGIPLGEWGIPKFQIEGRGKAFPLMVICLFAFVQSLLADVTCIWNGSGYDCSGTGERVIVQGGGYLAPVVTNVVGVCTNCSAIPPDSLRSIGDTLAQKAEELSGKADQIIELSIDISNLCRSNLQEIATYEHFFGPSVVMIIWATNYMARANNGQTQGMQYAYDSALADTSTKAAHAGGAGNGIYYYANNTVAPQLTQAKEKVNTIEQSTMEINTEIVPSLRSLSEQILEGATECQGSTNNATGGQGGGALTGDWCTYEQGESIISLLQDLKYLLQGWEDYLENIEKYIKQTRDVISKGLFSEYTNIPQQLDWQTVYLQGQETDWGYVPTNTLQRIELLMYGLSGVGTNTTDFTQDEINPDTLKESSESELDSLTNLVASVRTDADDAPVRSLGQAVVGFFGAFSRDGRSMQGGEEVIPSYSFRVGDSELYVPTITLGDQNGASIHNRLQSSFSMVMSVLYAVVCAWCIFLYWRWFAERAVAMSKWAFELLSSLFSA